MDIQIIYRSKITTFRHVIRLEIIEAEDILIIEDATNCIHLIHDFYKKNKSIKFI